MKLNAALCIVFTVFVTCKIVEGTPKQKPGRIRSRHVKDNIWSKLRYYMNKSGPKNTDCTCRTNCDIDIERRDDNGVCCRSQECCLPCNETLECTSRNGTCQTTCGENEIATDTSCCNGLKCCEMPQCTDDKDCNCKTECDGIIEREDIDGSCCDNLKCCKPCADTLQCTSRNGTCQASCGENENATDTACCNGLQCCEIPLCTDDTDCDCKTECDGAIEGEDGGGFCCDNLKCCKPCTDTLQCTSRNGTCQASCGENENATDTACCNGLKCCEMPLCTDDTDCNCKTDCDGVIEGHDRGGSCCNNLKCCKPCTGVCGGNFTELIGSFSSTNYPCNYPPDQDCFYIINVPVGHTVTLTFRTFSLEPPAITEFDIVDIYDGESVNDPLLLHLPGGLLDGTTVQSTANKMLVRFQSDFLGDFPGFDVNYIASITG
ncbi:uncharacterized protein [Mytilus edulis]|uniref:uncharacterized protein isoform X1 n=1 Tax=Mytilus edulis TaxID=6550 RepID=UPI0039EF117D